MREPSDVDVGQMLRGRWHQVEIEEVGVVLEVPDRRAVDVVAALERPDILAVREEGRE